MKTTVNEASQCPSCGKPMPAGALAGLCPACLLAQGADTDAGGAGRFEPPPLAEVAKLFPQLDILDLLGAGGMGAVYKARQPALDRIVALKILPSQNARGVNFAERFNREARALARLNHPNIVAVHEFGQAGALSYFIMEFVDGANLRMLEQGSRLSPREALQLIPQICDALQYAHDEGVVHRDIKPENVLVDRKGRVKIADFGLAKILGVDANALRLTAEGQVMGTPHYMAPEQIEKPLSVDHRADIYALGVVFYEMLTGDLPLGKFSPPSRKVQVDVRFDDVVLRALENDPARRYQHASEVKTQVENIAGTPAPSIPAPAPEENYLRWAGFPVVVERDGARRVNRKEALKAFGILFGVLTIGFGLVSLVTGRTWFGWLGISGSLSLQLRLLIAALVTAFGVWRAWRSKPAAARPLPQTPQGTVILPPEKFSRKAVIGACWAPFFVLAALLYFLVANVTTVPAGATSLPARSTHWWQILLSVTVLPLGLGAPFGTTILGWIAVGDIRRAHGRISGLPLAVFDGLFFPLLALDGFLIWAWMTIVSGLSGQAVFEPFHAGEVSVLTKLGAASICVMVDLLIIRRVWRAVQSDGGAPVEPWWSSRKGAIAIGVACALIVAAVGQRREKPPGIFKKAAPHAPAASEEWSSPTLGPGEKPDPDIRAQAAAIVHDPQFKSQATDSEAKSAYAGAGAALDEPPRLRFLAWQEEWKTNQPAGAWHTDGSPVTDQAEINLLRSVPASRMDVSATEAARRNPRFLHLWFSHPLLNLQSLNNITLIDSNGVALKLGADSAVSSGAHPPTQSNGNVAWLPATLSPGEGDQVPSAVTVRLRYAMGLLERYQEVAADFRGGMSLEGGSQLNGIGQGADGRTFVAIAVDARKNESRHFGVVAITRDGREMAHSGGGSSGNVGSGVRVEKFEFNTPLADIARFRIGTRPIRTMEWTNVVLFKGTQ